MKVNMAELVTFCNVCNEVTGKSELSLIIFLQLLSVKEESLFCRNFFWTILSVFFFCRNFIRRVSNFSQKTPYCRIKSLFCRNRKFFLSDRKPLFVILKYSNKRKTADFVPKFQVEKGECAQIFCAQRLWGDQKNMFRKKNLRKFCS